jgi:hypothetical protein
LGWRGVAMFGITPTMAGVLVWALVRIAKPADKNLLKFTPVNGIRGMKVITSGAKRLRFTEWIRPHRAVQGSHLVARITDLNTIEATAKHGDRSGASERRSSQPEHPPSAQTYKRTP